MKKPQPKKPFHTSLAAFGGMVAFMLVLIDVPWPIYRFFGINWPLSVLLAIGCIVLAVVGVMFNILSGIAYRVGKSRSSGNGSSGGGSNAAGSNGAIALQPGPAGQSVQPKP